MEPTIKRTVERYGIHHDGRWYYHSSIIVFRGVEVAVRKNKNNLLVFNMDGVYICTATPVLLDLASLDVEKSHVSV